MPSSAGHTIDLTVEAPISLSAARLLPQLQKNGKAPSIPTVFRWVQRGVRGHKLRTLQLPSGRVTTSQAVDRFIAALSGEPTPSHRPNRQRKNDHDKAVRELEQDGIK